MKVWWVFEQPGSPLSLVHLWDYLGHSSYFLGLKKMVKRCNLPRNFFFIFVFKMGEICRGKKKSKKRTGEKKNTSDGTRTRNPRLRRPMPYPLGYGGLWTTVRKIALINEALSRSPTAACNRSTLAQRLVIR